MAGIYLHIPFCKQKCHYCNFYSVASINNKDRLFNALLKEIELQKRYLGNETVETIYFGGGTPSLLSADEINRVLSEISRHFQIAGHPEITLEANPDDLNNSYFRSLRNTSINRLSIGVQSFFEDDLKYLNRIHSAEQAINSIKEAQDTGFPNLSIDLIYGIPTLSKTKWQENLGIFYDLSLPHLSAYALTVEPKTALATLIKKKKIVPVEDNRIVEHFNLLLESMTINDFTHYEISNFCRENHYSNHNKNYWFGKKYLGIGPSAHSYNGVSRQWNISNIKKYIEEIQNDRVLSETETLSIDQKYNEYILTSLRTIWGIDPNFILEKFGNQYNLHFINNVKRFVDEEKISIKDGIYCLADTGKIFADGISSDLFV